MNLLFCLILALSTAFALAPKKVITTAKKEKTAPKMSREQIDLISTICSKTGISPGHATEDEIDEASQAYIKKYGPFSSDICNHVYDGIESSSINQLDFQSESAKGQKK